MKTQRLTPLRAIRLKCLDCQANSYLGVRQCEDSDCPLYPYRSGKRPPMQGAARGRGEPDVTKVSKPALHWLVLNRDNFRCQYCGRNPTQHGVVLVIDHIKPKADGGKDTLDNLVTACRKCNSAKATRPLRYEAEFKKRLKMSKTSMVPQLSFKFYLGG